MRFAVLSCGLAPRSRSRLLAGLAAEALDRQGHTVSLLDARDDPLPLFDNDRVFAHPAFARWHGGIDGADGVVLASPVYNWQLSAEAKRVVEATGATGEGGRRSAWFDKVVTMLCAGGLPHAYLAYGPLAVSLMTDFKCVLNPYVTYATDDDWRGDRLTERLEARLDKTLAVHAELCGLLAARRYRSDWEV